MGKIYPFSRTPKVRGFHYQNGVMYKKRRTGSFIAGLLVVGLLSGIIYKTGLIPEFAKPPLARGVSSEQLVTPQQPTSGDLSRSTDLQQQDEVLESSINKVLGTFPDSKQWSVYVQDLDTKRSVNINADQVYDAGSLYKLFLIAPLETKIPADKWSSRISDTTIKDCVDSMLKISDSDCAKSIGYMVNLDYADRFNQSLGYKNTKLSGTPQTTAREVGDLLTVMKQGKIFSDKGRRIVFDALYAQKSNEGIPTGCVNCRTANKAGQTDTVAHDAGIVTHGKHSYVVVVMSKGGNFQQISQVVRAVETELNP